MAYLNLKKHVSHKFFMSVQENNFRNRDEAGEDNLSLLDDLTPNDVRLLIKAEEELNQTRNWIRLVPSNKDTPYLPQTYSDNLLKAWETKYGISVESREEGREKLRNLCKEGFHLRISNRWNSRLILKNYEVK